ncbi:MAG: GGDEF domain-containing protein [Desulfobacteraceae bacterium]|nr:GGDEF domain-containing protein [Desulfobacteraceae bacterium]
MNLLEEKQPDCPTDKNTCPLQDRIRRLEEKCKELEALSQVDALTGFFNYRYLMNALEQEMERTRRTGVPASLIMGDLDYFKRINDTYGHENGNLVLKTTAGIWRSNLRRIDIPCRYGGEEFVFILPGTRLPQAIQTAERLRRSLEKSPLSLDGKPIVLTGSFGVTGIVQDQDMTSGSIIETADQLVLRAKSNGRNRVCYDTYSSIAESTGVRDEEKNLLLGTDRPTKQKR